jgi:copper chaperone NosL
MNVKFLFMTLFIALMLSACGAQQSSEPRAPDIAYNHDTCDSCGMLISEARFAAATVMNDGQTRKFDDIGEMISYHMEHPQLQVKAYFVHDYNSQNWIRGETAFYVINRDIRSPMGKGYAAFFERNDADALAIRLNARVLTFDEMRIAVHVVVHGG